MMKNVFWMIVIIMGPFLLFHGINYFGRDKTNALKPEQLISVSGAVQRELDRMDLLCLDLPAMPYSSSSGYCDHCSALAQAGLLTEKQTSSGYEYDLSDDGHPLYHEKRERHPDAVMCFGTLAIGNVDIHGPRGRLGGDGPSVMRVTVRVDQPSPILASPIARDLQLPDLNPDGKTLAKTYDYCFDRKNPDGGLWQDARECHF